MKAQSVANFSSYTITWVEVRPTKGIAPLKDIATLDAVRHTGGRGFNGNLYLHFPTKGLAEQWLAKVSTLTLSKQYECRLFSDKQFGMIRRENNYTVPFTSQQNKDVRIIG